MKRLPTFRQYLSESTDISTLTDKEKKFLKWAVNNIQKYSKPPYRSPAIYPILNELFQRMFGFNAKVDPQSYRTGWIYDMLDLPVDYLSEEDLSKIKQLTGRRLHYIKTGPYSKECIDIREHVEDLINEEDLDRAIRLLGKSFLIVLYHYRGTNKKLDGYFFERDLDPEVKDAFGGVISNL